MSDTALAAGASDTAVEKPFPVRFAAGFFNRWSS